KVVVYCLVDAVCFVHNRAPPIVVGVNPV
ncbi:MAG: hypothetical protein JWO93_2327, partial [Micrococcaceae bacterium]|nr:hypothetical protein [Micrococcaceae bacterium]